MSSRSVIGPDNAAIDAYTKYAGMDRDDLISALGELEHDLIRLFDLEQQKLERLSAELEEKDRRIEVLTVEKEGLKRLLEYYCS
jgi:hypothetical protein